MAEAKSSFVSELSLYEAIPTGHLQLEEFERYALLRLKLLREVEGAVTQRKRDPKEDIKRIFNQCFKEFPACEVERVDALSHYALRLASCQDKERRAWFIRNEKALLNLRVLDLDTHKRMQFLKSQGLGYTQIDTQERKELKQELAAVFVSRYELEKMRRVNSDDYKTFYKVPFERVPGLVALRHVFLRRGFAYVSKDDVHTLIDHHYEHQLTQMEHLWQARIAQEEEDRLVPIIESIHAKSRAMDYRFKASQDGVEDLEDLANKHFPLCMKHLYDKVLEEHHLKHNGRLQLQLFLKGIGLPYQQTYDFLKAAFAPKTGEAQFDKQYGYNIRHNYGLEGGRVDYTPYSCSKILSCVLAAGEHAGCPFKTFTADALKHALQQKGLSDTDVEEVLMAAKGSHYRRACQLTWQACEGQPSLAAIEHPNQYYLASVKARRGLPKH